MKNNSEEKDSKVFSNSLKNNHTGTGESLDSLTNRQGHPITDNQNVRTVGNRGLVTIENYDFIEKMSHFDRERIPERVVHARGAGAPRKESHRQLQSG